MPDWIKYYSVENPLLRYETISPEEASPTGDPPKEDPPAGDPPAASAIKKDETFELEVGGEKKLVTLEELRSLATESAGAQKKFSDASELRKEGEKGLRVLQLLDTLDDPENKPYDAEVKELAALMNIDGEEFMEKYAAKEAEKEPAPAGGGTMTLKELSEGLKEVLGMSIEDAKGILAMSRQGHITEARGNIKAAVKEAVDKDEVFAKLVGKGDKKDDRFEIITDDVLEGVLQRISQGDPFGADVIQSETQKVRSKYTKFGIPNTLDLHPNLGQLSDGINLPADVRSEEPIKRIPASEDGAEENFAKRWMQKALKARLSSG